MSNMRVRRGGAGFARAEINGLQSEVTASQNHSLDILLELICARIQLTNSQYESANQHYRAISDWLARVGSPLELFSPTIYPQGSLSLGTTTRPLRRAEFDLDSVCQMSPDGNHHPGKVYRLIWDRIAAHDGYKKIMERLPRCIRLNYAGDFHLDIVPAVPDLEAGDTCILVPDLDANLALDAPENDRWKPSNPKGYQTWFEDRCNYGLTEKYARAHVEPLPDNEAVHEKPALKRSVQLFKRWRDKEFQDRPNLAPPSIILTTLSGHLYQGETWCTDALRTILNRIGAIIDSGESICLTNPANDKEHICEKWQNVPGSFDAFAEAVARFRDRWEQLLGRCGIDGIAAELADLFEDEPNKPVKWAIEEYSRRRVGGPRSQNTLVMDRVTGALGVVASAASISVRPNKFFGDEEHKP